MDAQQLPEGLDRAPACEEAPEECRFEFVRVLEPDGVVQYDCEVHLWSAYVYPEAP